MSTHLYKNITQNKFLLFTFITLVIIFLYHRSLGINVEIHQEQPFQKYWVWLDDKTGMEKKLFNQEAIQFKVTVDKKYPNALIFWQLKDRYSKFSQAGFEVRKDDVGLCKKIVHIDDIGRITKNISFYKDKFGICSNEGSVKTQ